MPKKKWFYQYVGDTPIVPISTKILAVFICLLLLSNFITNYINIQMNHKQVISLTNQVMVNQLKEIYSASSNQFEIFKYSGDSKEAFSAIASTAQKGFTDKNSIALGIQKEGDVLFCECAGILKQSFSDSEALKLMNDNLNAGKTEGSIHFKMDTGEYLGVYKYHDDWNCYLIRGELVADMERASNIVFLIISIIILILTALFLFIGLKMFSRILRYIKQMTESLYKMQASQSLDLIDLTGAPNDDVTYLGASFNSLSSTINNLLGIFRKFVSKDVVEKAYSDHIIRLEGTQKELSILFSDIRGFTYMTETLGNDIINLLNIHYDRVIHKVHQEEGTIGSIIGDAILAMFGTLNMHGNKSVQAIKTAWEITEVTAELREKMQVRRQEIEKSRELTESEQRVFKAVLLDVGVGIDGGTVFYGNIGSVEHMTNTVIGDNVNSASRLEGLTRVYHLPVIVSKYIKEEAEKDTDEYRFIEIDTVQVKGKTEGKHIYLPLIKANTDEATLRKYEIFELGLKAYYDGDWTQAKTLFETCNLEMATVFLDRISIGTVPSDWRGIWTMTTK